MDRLAEALGMDAVVLRERNALRNGDRIITSQPVEGSAPVADVIRRCAELPLPPERESDDPLDLPGGAGNLTRGEDVRRGGGVAPRPSQRCYSHPFCGFFPPRAPPAPGQRGAPPPRPPPAAGRGGGGGRG